MTNGECEKIIDRVTDPRNLDEQCRQHIKTCAKCAAVIACLTWVKTKGSPTADLKPSEAFLKRLDQSLTPPSGGSSTAPAFTINLAAWLIGIVVTLVISAAIITGFNDTSRTATNPPSAADLTDKEISITESESEILNTQPDTPVLKFQSPADEID